MGAAPILPLILTEPPAITIFEVPFPEVPLPIAQTEELPAIAVTVPPKIFILLHFPSLPPPIPAPDEPPFATTVPP